MGQFCGKRVFLCRIALTVPENRDLPFIFRLVQFHTKPFCNDGEQGAGQTPNTVGLNVPQPVLSSG